MRLYCDYISIIGWLEVKIVRCGVHCPKTPKPQTYEKYNKINIKVSYNEIARSLKKNGFDVHD